MLSKLGGFPAGVTCFVEDGILCCEYNLFEIQRTKISARLQLPPGKVKIEIETNHPDFVPRGPLNVTMKVNGELVAEGTAPVTCPIAFSVNECLDIGIAVGSPVSLDYYDKAPFRFNGTIERVEVRYTPRNRNETPDQTEAAREESQNAAAWRPERRLGTGERHCDRRARFGDREFLF